jgi:hypothetical protein
MNGGLSELPSVPDASRGRVVVIRLRSNRFHQDAVIFPDQQSALDFVNTLTKDFTHQYEVAIVELSSTSEIRELYGLEE